jgi:hypothetical protein
MIIQLRTDYEAQERARLERVWNGLDEESRAVYGSFNEYFKVMAYEPE